MLCLGSRGTAGERYYGLWGTLLRGRGNVTTVEEGFWLPIFEGADGRHISHFPFAYSSTDQPAEARLLSAFRAALRRFFIAS
jgi:hypothetical protein